MVRVGVAVQEAHRDRGAGRQALHRGARLVEVERTQDTAVPGHAFVDLQRAPARNEGRGFQGRDVVEDGAVGAGDLEHVPEPGRGQHPDLGPPSLQDRVRADGDAVDEALHFREVDAEAFENVDDRAGRVRRRGGDLCVAKRPGRIVEHRRVGERSAYVHADAESSLSVRHASFWACGVEPIVDISRFPAGPASAALTMVVQGGASLLGCEESRAGQTRRLYRHCWNYRAPTAMNGFSTVTPAKFMPGCRSSESSVEQPPIRAASTIAASQ